MGQSQSRIRPIQFVRGLFVDDQRAALDLGMELSHVVKDGKIDANGRTAGFFEHQFYLRESFNFDNPIGIAVPMTAYFDIHLFHSASFSIQVSGQLSPRIVLTESDGG